MPDPSSVLAGLTMPADLVPALVVAAVVLSAVVAVVLAAAGRREPADSAGAVDAAEFSLTTTR